MSGEFAIGSSTASKIVREVAADHRCSPWKPTRETWTAALLGFMRSSSNPAAIGALDGKHIACVEAARCTTITKGLTASCY